MITRYCIEEQIQGNKNKQKSRNPADDEEIGGRGDRERKRVIADEGGRS